MLSADHSVRASRSQHTLGKQGKYEEADQVKSLADKLERQELQVRELSRRVRSLISTELASLSSRLADKRLGTISGCPVVVLTGIDGSETFRVEESFSARNALCASSRHTSSRSQARAPKCPVVAPRHCRTKLGLSRPAGLAWLSWRP